MKHPILEVNGVWKRLCRRPEKALGYAMADLGRALLDRPMRDELRDGEFWALRNIDLKICAGEVIGVIGQNGAGKSTLINLASRVILPTFGSINLNTTRVALIDSDGGLNPIQTGRENVLMQLALHGVPESMFAEESRDVEAFADLGDFFDAPVGTYSVGMRLRLAFSVYSRLKPDLFIIDEALGGGDDRFRNKFRAYLRNYIDGGGSMLLCSHEMLAIQSFCERCILLDRGNLIMSGSSVATIARHHQLSRERETEQVLATQPKLAKHAGEAAPHPCEIKTVKITTATGDIVRPGAQVMITVEVAVTEEIEGVACGIEIGLGEFVSLATLTGGYPHGEFTLRPPLTSLSCQIDHLPLVPGSYDLRIALSLPRSAVTLGLLGYTDNPVQFSIEAITDEISNLVRGRDNIVYMPTEWSVSNTATIGGE